jgi:hypothetical protein
MARFKAYKPGREVTEFDHMSKQLTEVYDAITANFKDVEIDGETSSMALREDVLATMEDRIEEISDVIPMGNLLSYYQRDLHNRGLVVLVPASVFTAAEKASKAEAAEVKKAEREATKAAKAEETATKKADAEEKKAQKKAEREAKKAEAAAKAKSNDDAEVDDAEAAE